MKGRERKRVEKELEDMRQKNQEGGPVSADSVSPDNIQKWLGIVQGPEASPYDKGFFILVHVCTVCPLGGSYADLSVLLNIITTRIN